MRGTKKPHFKSPSVQTVHDDEMGIQKSISKWCGDRNNLVICVQTRKQPFDNPPNVQEVRDGEAKGC